MHFLYIATVLHLCQAQIYTINACTFCIATQLHPFKYCVCKPIAVCTLCLDTCICTCKESNGDKWNVDACQNQYAHILQNSRGAVLLLYSVLQHSNCAVSFSASEDVFLGYCQAEEHLSLQFQEEQYANRSLSGGRGHTWCSILGATKRLAQLSTLLSDQGDRCRTQGN